MVREETELKKYYVCEICESWHNTLELAELCEKSPLRKEVLVQWERAKQPGEEWKLGEILVAYHHDREPFLVQIVDTVVKGHIIKPVFEHLTTGKRELKTFSGIEAVTFLTKEMKLRLLKWLKLFLTTHKGELA